MALAVPRPQTSFPVAGRGAVAGGPETAPRIPRASRRSLRPTGRTPPEHHQDPSKRTQRHLVPNFESVLLFAKQTKLERIPRKDVEEELWVQKQELEDELWVQNKGEERGRLIRSGESL